MEHINRSLFMTRDSYLFKMEYCLFSKLTIEINILVFNLAFERYLIYRDPSSSLQINK